MVRWNNEYVSEKESAGWLGSLQNARKVTWGFGARPGVTSEYWRPLLGEYEYIYSTYKGISQRNYYFSFQSKPKS